MTNWLETIVITLVGSTSTGFIAWFFARKKNAAEAKSVELENVAAAVTIWREAAEELSKQLKIYNDQLLEQRGENEKLRLEIHELRKEIESLKNQNAKLVKEMKEIKRDPCAGSHTS